MAIDAPTTPVSSIDDISSLLRFLGDPTRLRLIARMARSEACVCDLTEELGLSQPLVSYHLAKLRSAGMVHSRREGSWMYYSLDPEAWRTTLSPIRALLELGDLPPAAAQGTREACDPA